MEIRCKAAIHDPGVAAAPGSWIAAALF